jgi:hypothetical protein
MRCGVSCKKGCFRTFGSQLPYIVVPSIHVGHHVAVYAMSHNTIQVWRLSQIRRIHSVPRIHADLRKAESHDAKFLSKTQRPSDEEFSNTTTSKMHTRGLSESHSQAANEGFVLLLKRPHRHPTIGC